MFKTTFLLLLIYDLATNSKLRTISKSKTERLSAKHSGLPHNKKTGDVLFQFQNKNNNLALC